MAIKKVKDTTDSGMVTVRNKPIIGGNGKDPNTATKTVLTNASASNTGNTGSGSASSSANSTSANKKTNTNFQTQFSNQVNSIMNRLGIGQTFDYDQANDPLYKQYKDLYMENGQRAMKDTVAQGAALTGGYGNSWAQTAGQQMYNQYAGQLADKGLELRNQAYNEWDNNRNYAMGLAQTEQNIYSNYVNQLLAQGKMPSEAMLAAVGLSKKDAKKLMAKVKVSGGVGSPAPAPAKEKTNPTGPSFRDVNIADFPYRDTETYKDLLTQYLQNREAPKVPIANDLIKLRLKQGL